MQIDRVVWDLEDDPDGNVQHIAEHGLSMEEVEDVLAGAVEVVASASSGLPITFGWTSTGRYIAVVFEVVEESTAGRAADYSLRNRTLRRERAPMVERAHRKQKRTTAQAARDKAVRAQFARKPTKRELLASADYVGPMSIEEYLAWRTGKSDAPLTGQLQAALRSCGKSVYAIAQESGVSAPILQRFLSGQRGITLETAGRLAAYLGLGLWPNKGRT